MVLKVEGCGGRCVTPCEISGGHLRANGLGMTALKYPTWEHGTGDLSPIDPPVVGAWYIF